MLRVDGLHPPLLLVLLFLFKLTSECFVMRVLLHCLDEILPFLFHYPAHELSVSGVFWSTVLCEQLCG
jgi:hypothetical protein